MTLTDPTLTRGKLQQRIRNLQERREKASAVLDALHLDVSACHEQIRGFTARQNDVREELRRHRALLREIPCCSRDANEDGNCDRHPNGLVDESPLQGRCSVGEHA